MLAPRCGQAFCMRPTDPPAVRYAIRFSPSSRTRSGEPSGSGSSLESAAGIQYWRISAPIGVPGPTRQRSSLSSRLSMRVPPLGDVERRHPLAVHRIRDGVFERQRLAPLARRTHAPVGTDLIDAPVDLEVVAVGILELHGELAARAPSALEVDRHAVLVEPRARPEDFVRRADLEREVIQRAL